MLNELMATTWYCMRHGSVWKYARDKIFYRDLHADWNARTAQVLACPDNEQIPRHPSAGNMANGGLVMHCGVTVAADSYYGDEAGKLLQLNKGVHEPQEERIFHEVLKTIHPGATMVELGAYWGFYSLWFLAAVRDARAFLIEPDEANLRIGKRNFELNAASGDFTHAFVGQTTNENGRPPTVSVDDFTAQKAIEHVTILHSDIQGHEVDMLHGAQRLFDERRLDYVFVSTHGLRLHNQCLRFLKQNRFTIIGSADRFESYSLDGVIVARRSELEGCGPIAISRR
ncbi:MAG: FkbM family methyltransferase [Candidatus Paceibacterota bacterium]